MEDLIKDLMDKLESNKETMDSPISSIINIIAENTLLKIADDTARSLIMSIVMDNGGSITLKNRVDHKTCGYELAVEPSEGDSLIFKAVKKDVSVN
jgi:hypothetical protein